MWCACTFSILSTSPVLAQVALGSTTAYEKTPAGTSHTFSVNCSGTDRYGLLAYLSDGSTATVSATHAGNAMTALHNQTTANNRAAFLGIVAPTTGAQNVVVTVSASSRFNGAFFCLTGVDQTTSTLSPVGSSGTGTSVSDTVTSAANDLVMDALLEGWGATTVGTGQTQRFNNTSMTSYFGWGSTEPGAASVPMTWTIGGSPGEYVHIAINVKAVGGGGGPTLKLFWGD